MAEDLNRTESTPTFAAPAPPARRSARAPAAAAVGVGTARGPLPHRLRRARPRPFVTVIALAVGLTRNDSNTVPWSSWTPTASGTQEVDQIVEHVGTRYRLPSGRQMVAVVPRSPAAENPPISTVAIDKQALFTRSSNTARTRSTRR